jgi:methylthioribose-1-phosphate isomerase
MKITTISWEKSRVKIIDQTKLPHSFEHLYISSLKEMADAVRKLRVRGAPALGAAGALGVYLGVRDFKGESFKDFKGRLKAACRQMAASRPTARNLFWGIERVFGACVKDKNRKVSQAKQAVLKEALDIIEEDRRSCRRIADCGAGLVKDGDSILTICNAGILATVDYGTALGVIYRAKEKGKSFKVYACETRPLLQGSRLTAWELKKKGIDVEVICDNTAASLMGQGRVNLVIAGADRIAANGDAANKIGTLGLAILCKYHAVPFYIAAPASTFDLKLRNGGGIVIEERSYKEVTGILGLRNVAAREVNVFNPAFDVTDNSLIKAFITDKGVIVPPYGRNIRKALC